MNTLGYYGVFLGLQYQNSLAMTRQLDADRYDELQTVTIQVPLSVPYMYNDADFKRAEGTFEYNGESYRLVKQKYSNDTLTMICVRDTENERIQDALSDYVMSFTDNAGDEHQGSTLTVSFIKDYLPQAFSILTSSPGWQAEVVNSDIAGNLIPTFTASVIHPPERA
ncbi:MAG TPA: hypothetical protein VK508_06990 [Cyclobacteriaceae bacterium]|nr:hypothetical protein [Cyclobacteriaceae bacterium]